MTDKQKKTIMMRTLGQTCCQGYGKVIHPETDDLSRVEYVKTKRGGTGFSILPVREMSGGERSAGKSKGGIAMERLTHPRNSGIKTGYWSPNKKDELVERLAAYEDTGLTPEEIERLKEQHRWIPVEERLPEEDTIVLLTVSGLYSCITFSDAIELGNLCSDGEWFIEGYPDWDDPEVTAWMLLPEPYRPGE